jgi:hypothetical protein
MRLYALLTLAQLLSCSFCRLRDDTDWLPQLFLQVPLLTLLLPGSKAGRRS